VTVPVVSKPQTEYDAQSALASALKADDTALHGGGAATGNRDQREPGGRPALSPDGKSLSSMVKTCSRLASHNRIEAQQGGQQ
jgi:hypothetical protein